MPVSLNQRRSLSPQSSGEQLAIGGSQTHASIAYDSRALRSFLATSPLAAASSQPTRYPSPAGAPASAELRSPYGLAPFDAGGNHSRALTTWADETGAGPQHPLNTAWFE
jgi:hypothetical protein